MKIAIISDTHVGSGQVDELMDLLVPHLRGADHILHAGDVVDPALLAKLQDLAPVDAVAGNMDGEEITGAWPERSVFEFAGTRVGLMHGWGAPQDLPRRVWERFIGADMRPEVDVIVFGHSHHALVEERQGVLMVNPGSPTDRRWAPFRSLAYLDLQADSPPHASILRLED